MQRGHRHVQLVAAGVLQCEEFGRPLVDFQRLETEIAADAVVLVHHRRAGGEVAQVADDRLGVALAGPALGLRTTAAAEQLRLGQDGEGVFRRRAQEALVDRKHGQPAPRRGGAEVGEALERFRADAEARQGAAQHLAAARGVGGEQHAAGKTLEEVEQRGGRFLAALVNAQVRRRLGREARARGRRRVVGRQVGLGQRIEPRLDRVRIEEQFRRIQDRALDVVAPLLPALQRSPLQVARRLRRAVLQHQLRRRRQVVEQVRGLFEEQR